MDRITIIKKQKLRVNLIFGLVLLFSFVLRIYGLNWDAGFHMHPDERMVVMVVEKLQLPSSFSNFLDPNSLWNPQFFAYGSLPLYLLKLFSIGASFFLGKEWLFYQNLPILGRLLSVVFDLGVVVLVFKIGSRLFNKKIGLCAAAFYGLSVFPIQLAHFYAVDVVLNFFIWLTLWALICFYHKPKFSNACFVGFCFGSALATKASAGVLLLSIGFVLVLDFILIGFKFFRQEHQPFFKKILFFFKKSLKKRVLLRISKQLFFLGGSMAVVFFVCFFVFQPYAFLDFSKFFSQVKQQGQMTKDAYVFPYTLQYVDTLAYLYPLKNIFVWGLGLSLGLVSFSGFGFYFFDLFKRLLKKGDYDQEAKEVIVFIFVFVYFLIVGGFSVKFMRYLLPVYPFLVLVGAWFLIKKERLKKIIPIVFTGHLFYLLAFLSIYSRANTRVQATEWINKYIPDRSVIAIEHWDDRLPLVSDKRFSFLEMPMYELDSSSVKWQKIEANLAEADYLILASNRLHVPLRKLTDCQKHKKCYPKTALFYDDLFAGNLDFNQLVKFESFPGFEFLNFKIDDSGADESFTVYDHPQIFIFAKDKN